MESDREALSPPHACGSPAVDPVALPDAEVETIQLLIQMLGSHPHSWFRDLGQTLGAMSRSVDGAAAAWNCPATIQRFDPIHRARDIFADGEIMRPSSFNVRIPCSP